MKVDLLALMPHLVYIDVVTLSILNSICFLHLVMNRVPPNLKLHFVKLLCFFFLHEDLISNLHIISFFEIYKKKTVFKSISLHIMIINMKNKTRQRKQRVNEPSTMHDYKVSGDLFID